MGDLWVPPPLSRAFWWDVALLLLLLRSGTRVVLLGRDAGDGAEADNGGGPRGPVDDFERPGFVVLV